MFDSKRFDNNYMVFENHKNMDDKLDLQYLHFFNIKTLIRIPIANKLTTE